jgi:DNA polymerase I
MFDQFTEVVVVDTESTAIPGERPVPVCLVAREMRGGRTYRIFQGEFGSVPPYATGPDVLFVAFVAQAELGVYRALNWPLPERVLDLYVEFRRHTNMGSKEDQAERTPAGRGLVGASIFFGLPAPDTDEKMAIQKAVGNGTWQSRYSPEQILDYCQRDVEATERLLAAMLPTITNLHQAVLRGRYTKAVAAMEWTGTPIDTGTLAVLRENWTTIQDHLIDEVDAGRGIFEGRSFVENRFAAWLEREGIPWTRLRSGRLDLDDKRTFRHMAKMYPAISPLRELRHALAEMRLNDLAARSDGRNRTSLWPFGTRTGRNTPGNSEFRPPDLTDFSMTPNRRLSAVRCQETEFRWC